MKQQQTVWGIHVVSLGEEKERLRWKGFAVRLRQDGENTVSTPLETRHDHLWPGPAAILRQ